MSSTFARRALGIADKPHSSITDWIELLTSNNVEDEAYDGIPELVDSINLQASGPSEASRALRKKIKHGAAHQQYRSLVLLKALVENCGSKFQTTFADGHLTDALKSLSSDPLADKKVKKKLNLILASWHGQFKNDPYMTAVVNIYKPPKPESHKANPATGLMYQPDQRTVEREEAKRKIKLEKERRRQEEEDRKMQARQAKHAPKRAPFDFEKEKPKVLASIVDASQASSNLVNAITLVNTEKDSLLVNDTVQESLVRAKQMRKLLVRYIQLVENEELIGTLIETNERILAALEMYDKLSTPETTSGPEAAAAISAGLAAANLSGSQTELHKLQERQRYEVERHGKGKDRDAYPESPTSPAHPDLQDLDFGDGDDSLPPPIRPRSSGFSPDSDGELDSYDQRGSLSDFSDYDSETDQRANGSSSKRYVAVSDDERPSPGKKSEVDPFADPFAG